MLRSPGLHLLKSSKHWKIGSLLFIRLQGLPSPPSCFPSTPIGDRIYDGLVGGYPKSARFESIGELE